MIRRLTLLLVLLAPSAVFASNPAATPPPPEAAVNGVIADPTGAIVPGAEVDLVDTTGTVAGSCHSGDDGTFQLVPPHSGNFTLVVSEPGFETTRTPVVVAAPASAVAAATGKIGALL